MEVEKSLFCASRTISFQSCFRLVSELKTSHLEGTVTRSKNSNQGSNWEDGNGRSGELPASNVDKVSQQHAIAIGKMVSKGVEIVQHTWLIRSERKPTGIPLHRVCKDNMYNDAPYNRTVP